MDKNLILELCMLICFFGVVVETEIIENSEKVCLFLFISFFSNIGISFISFFYIQATHATKGLLKVVMLIEKNMCT